MLTCAWATHFDTFWTNLWLEGLASGTTCGTNIVPGALPLLPFPYYPRAGHQFLSVGVFPDRRLYFERVRAHRAERGEEGAIGTTQHQQVRIVFDVVPEGQLKPLPPTLQLYQHKPDRLNGDVLLYRVQVG